MKTLTSLERERKSFTIQRELGKNVSTIIRIKIQIIFMLVNSCRAHSQVVITFLHCFGPVRGALLSSHPGLSRGLDLPSDQVRQGLARLPEVCGVQEHRGPMSNPCSEQPLQNLCLHQRTVHRAAAALHQEEAEPHQGGGRLVHLHLVSCCVQLCSS